MDTCQSDPFFIAVHLQVNVAVDAEGQLVLTDLVAFGKVGVEVIFLASDWNGIFAVGGNPARMANSTTFLFRTGRTPGNPMHTGRYSD